MPVERRLTKYAQTMRRGSTGPEDALWTQLRGRRLLGLRFRRQQPIGPFIVDFFCAEIGLIIELDGAGHDHQFTYDANRKRWLESEGYHVVRIGSDHRFSDPDDVLPFLSETCKKLIDDAPT